MGQQSILGAALRDRRKAANATQAAVAASAGVSLTALRAVERGQGRWTTLQLVTVALGVELRGRALMTGPIGPALAALRRQRQFSRRNVAKALGVSRNTLAALEGGTGLLSVLEAYAASIGAGLYFSVVGEPRAFFTHAGNSTSFQGWETPPELAAVLMRAAGGFDLDPCAASNDRRRARIKARLLLTAEDDGLSHAWHGRVFVNPPYGRALKAWVRKCAAEAASGRATVVGLIPARTDTRWWHDDVAGRAHVFLLRGRLRFGRGDDNAPFPSAVVVWGPSAELVAALKRELGDAWHIPPASPAS